MTVVSSGRADPAPLATHRFKLDAIEAACAVVSRQREAC